MGLLAKRHGNRGTISFRETGRTLRDLFRVSCDGDVLNVLQKLPNITIETRDGTLTVTFANWHKYQIDSSAERMRKLRNVVTPKKRREEKRAEEKNTTDHISPLKERFERFYSAYPKHKAPGDAEKAWNQIRPDDALLQQMLAAIARQRVTHDWTKDDGQWIPAPGKWLRGKCWLNEVKNEQHKIQGFSDKGQRSIPNIARGLGLENDPG